MTKTTRKRPPKSAKRAQESQGLYGALRRMSQTSVGRFFSSIIMALLIVIPVRILALQGYHIPSGSMEETLLIGDVLFADKITYGPRIPFTDGVRIPGFRSPKPGDIVIFKNPVDNVDLIKRCVAVEGQVVEMRKKQLYIDGELMDEPYAIHTSPYHPARDDFGPLTVPPGHIFLLGDNRDNSNDSRYLGPIPLKLVVAKARVIYFSWNTNGHPTRTLVDKVAQIWRGQPRLRRIGKVL